ncbi:MAG: hypothetical protein GWP29_06485 [Bacteroidetes bacterium]|jgi:hypothetical protein|nr:hypothetical protein [Flavobacteriaceae bacterium]MBT6127411.1 hypothetical protein [Flavobacteriaceae bacterium]MDG1941515.1 hypothetical protein [Flavobacteriaceae bacterium]NCF31509.1 hypothetical protein [Bacteroidota bacterium]
MKFIRFILLLFFMGVQTYALSQEARDEYLEPLNDPSADGQRFFVQDLLDIAGYVPERIQIYQTLPNQARVFRVKLDSVNGGFVFVRWDKVKKENFIANKMIDPGVYYNLNAAKEIMRKQTDKANFTVDDVALQAPDQEQINSADLDELRAEFDLKNEEKRLEQEDAAAKQNSRRERKEKRKEKKDNTSELQ